MLQVTTAYYRLLHVIKGYWEWLHINQFTTSYSLTIYQGCSFEEYLVSNSDIKRKEQIWYSASIFRFYKHFQPYKVKIIRRKLKLEKFTLFIQVALGYDRKFVRIWQEMTGYDRIWQEMIGYDRKFVKIWQDMTGYDRIWQDMKGYDRIWQDMTGYDRIW